MMIKKALLEHCAPTLAGLKTGNIFSVRTYPPGTNDELRMLNSILSKKGLHLLTINMGNRTLIYLYRPERLQKDLTDPTAKKILKEKGYPCGNYKYCLAELIKHLKSDSDFPHEIGLFLGYPPSDVKRFMESPCEGVKCAGCWKAYSNELEAKKTFEIYKKCTAFYSKECENGRPLEALIADNSSAIRFAI